MEQAAPKRGVAPIYSDKILFLYNHVSVRFISHNLVQTC